ncbi:hypothetical protein [Pseudomonas sp. PDM31]|uniref:hypothetical protein n=1 Tax=Pseudomonas sp. PDM31 TaxID=2854778 RepID=UPI001C44160C|nr:hypothetical protein [Pseudomonas sp. PDM31]MBV7476451.1 hypothetical protein [Pseudomonas sp. PDM31]
MNKVTRYLTAVAFAMAGAAAHANATVEQSACGASTCFQLTTVAGKGTHRLLAEDGSSRTPQGQMVAENGSSRTTQGQLLESQPV